MPITIKKNVMAYKDPTSNDYVGVDAVNDATLEERIGAVETALPDKYEKPANGIPATDIASGVIPDVSGKTDQGAVATPYTSLTWPVAKGKYCFYNGYVYRAKQGIATSESWTAAHWDQVVLGDEVSDVKTAIQGINVTPEMFGAKGDGTTDDAQAIRDAIAAGYNVRFDDNKTYFVGSSISITNDCHLIGGKNTKIKTATPLSGSMYNCFSIYGQLKKETTLESDYAHGNKFALTDIEGISIGDIMIITATDQYYSYARPMYYLGGTLLVSDIYDGNVYTSNGMPWGIENTENVSVKIYSAPEVIIENIDFVSDADEYDEWNYTYIINMNRCKNSTIRNCNLSKFYNGIMIQNCVNTKIDNVQLSKSKYDNNISADGYGIKIESSSTTIIERVLSICSQGCVDLGGIVPCIDTYISKCDLSSECRTIGIDMHENSYNVVIEDCVLGGASLYGTAIVNRCRVILNRRSTSDRCSIVLRGSHNPKWATLKVTDCIFEGANGITLDAPIPQSPVQAFVNTIGNVDIENCIGGYLIIIPSITSTITNNVIERLSIKNWKDCKEIYRTENNTIKYMELIDTPMPTNRYWISNHSQQKYATANINELHIISSKPLQRKLIADVQKFGAKFELPKDVSIEFSATDQTIRYVVCGKNLASNIAEDYVMGSVSGNQGNPLTRTVNSTFANAVSVNENEHIVITNPNSTAQIYLYPLCFYYNQEYSIVKMACTFKNIGETNAQKYRLYIAVVDCETGLVISRENGNAITPTEEGVRASFSTSAKANTLVLCYIGMTDTTVKYAETELIDYAINVQPCDMSRTLAYEPYDGAGVTGDETLMSVEGVNNIMCSAQSFDAKFKVDFINKW